MRIASLLPSATEIVCALGAGENLVGISHECDFPKEVTRLPRVTESHIDASNTSADIHSQVQGRARKGLSLYQIDWEKLIHLSPDIIITQDQCHVCAVDLSQVRAELSHYLAKPPTLVSLRPNTVTEVANSFLQVGEALNRPEAGRHLKANFIDRLNALCKQSKPHHKRVLFLEWLSPPMTAGHWTPELIEFAGGTPLQSEAGKSFRVLSENDFGKLQPEIIVVAPCGFSVSKTLQERGPLDAVCREWRAPIYIVDGNHFFNRSGPRLVESAEILHAIIHEKQIPHGDTVLYRG